MHFSPPPAILFTLNLIHEGVGAQPSEIADTFNRLIFRHYAVGGRSKPVGWTTARCCCESTISAMERIAKS